MKNKEKKVGREKKKKNDGRIKNDFLGENII